MRFQLSGFIKIIIPVGFLLSLITFSIATELKFPIDTFENITVRQNIILGGQILLEVDQLINASILPTEDDRFDIGSAAKRWQDGFFSNIVTALTFVGELKDGFRNENFTERYNLLLDRFGNENFTIRYDLRTDRFEGRNLSQGDSANFTYLNVSKNLLVLGIANFTGDVYIKDTQNETHLVNRVLQILDEMYSNVTLSGINGTLTNNSLTIRTLTGETIAVNIDAAETILDLSQDTIILTEGTNESPILNQVFYTNRDNPVLAKRTTLSEEVPGVAAFVLGANFTYASLIGGTTSANLVRGIYNRWLDQGAIYKSGFDLNVSTEEINISTGVMKILLSKLNINKNHSTSDFFVHVHTDGSFHQHTNLDDCATYSTGEPISNNKFFNLVCGIAFTHDEVGVMYCQTQDKPDSEHTKSIDAQLDVDFLRIFPPNNLIKLAYIPIVRVVVKRSAGDNTIQTLTTGKLFLDLRGTITANAGSTPSPSISSHTDLSNLDFSNAGHTGFQAEGGGITSVWNSSGINVFLNDSNGRVGIGTSTPTSKLHVIGDLNVSGSGYFGADVHINQSSLYIGEAKISYSVADDDGIMLEGSIHLEPKDGVSGNLALHEGTEPVACVSDDGGRLWYNLSNDLMWQDKNSVSRKVLLEGNVTSNSSPNIILQTSDMSEAYGINAGALSLIGGSKTTRYGLGGKIVLQGGRGRNAGNSLSGYAPILLQSNGGSVGIGTDSPGRLFEAFGSASVFRFRDSGDTASSTTAFIEFGGTDEGSWNRTGYMGDGQSANKDLLLVAEAGDLRLGDSSSYFVLTLSGGDATFTGNVGIGTTNPLEKLHVSGNLNVTGNIYAGGCIQYDCGTGTCTTLGSCI